MMHLLTSVLAGVALLDSVSAGRFSDRVHGRVARHEIAAQAEQAQKLESRGHNKGRYLTNKTMRE